MTNFMKYSSVMMYQVETHSNVRVVLFFVVSCMMMLSLSFLLSFLVFFVFIILYFRCCCAEQKRIGRERKVVPVPYSVTNSITECNLLYGNIYGSGWETVVLLAPDHLTKTTSKTCEPCMQA